MSNLRNSVRLIGFLGADPDIKAIGEKKKIAKVSIATNALDGRAEAKLLP